MSDPTEAALAAARARATSAELKAERYACWLRQALVILDSEGYALTTATIRKELGGEKE